MDITLQIMAYPPTHDLSYDQAKEARRYVRGDVIGVYRRSDCPEPPTEGTRMVFIHITGVPITTIRKAKKIMYSGETRRVWNINPQSLPSVIRQELINNREVTVTWTQAKPYILNKTTLTTITDEIIQADG